MQGEIHGLVKKEHSFLHSFAYRFLCHSFVYQRYGKLNDYYVNDHPPDRFHNIYFLWDSEWV